MKALEIKTEDVQPLKTKQHPQLEKQKQPNPHYLLKSNSKEKNYYKHPPSPIKHNNPST